MLRGDECLWDVTSVECVSVSFPSYQSPTDSPPPLDSPGTCQRAVPCGRMAGDGGSKASHGRDWSPPFGMLRGSSSARRADDPQHDVGGSDGAPTADFCQ